MNYNKIQSIFTLKQTSICIGFVQKVVGNLSARGTKRGEIIFKSSDSRNVSKSKEEPLESESAALLGAFLCAGSSSSRGLSPYVQVPQTPSLPVSHLGLVTRLHLVPQGEVFGFCQFPGPFHSS